MSGSTGMAQRVPLHGVVKSADSELGNWLMGLVSGQGTSPSQVIISGVLSVIPGLGQAMDVRDIVVGVIAISECKTDVSAWVDMSITLVGCIPVAGDGLKTGFRLMKGGSSLPRILDGMSPSIRGNLERWFKEINWGQISGSVKKNFDDVLGAFINGLDSWVAKTLGGKQEIEFLIAQIKDLRKSAPKMLDDAIEELQKLWRKAMGDASPRSSAAHGTPSAPHAVPKVKAPSAKVPVKENPKPVKTDRTATDANAANQAKNDERRAAKKRDKFQSGVLGEHLTDYWVAKNKRNLKKANNNGRVWEEWDKPGRQGIDHVWVQAGNITRPGVIGETKSSLLGAFKFMAALPADIKSQLNQLGDAEAANPTPQTQNSAKPVPNIFESEGRDGVTAKTRTDGTPQTESELKKGLGDTKTKGVQMSHRWIMQSIPKENLTVAGGSLAKEIRLYEKKYASGLDVKPPYARWIVMITGRQKHLHEKKQRHKHEIQSPLITLPDNILVE